MGNLAFVGLWVGRNEDGAMRLVGMENGTALDVSDIAHLLGEIHSSFLPRHDTPPHRRERLTAWQERGAKQFLLASNDKRVRVSEVAAHCNLSRSHFTRAFKRSTGHSPQRWLMLQRVQRAKDLLSGQQDIAAIAAECGFSDQSHLTRVFTRMVGMPPGAFRKSIHSGDNPP